MLHWRIAHMQQLLAVHGRVMRRAVWGDKAAWFVAQSKEVAADAEAGSSMRLWALAKAASGRQVPTAPGRSGIHRRW